jgi:hypothetical protein
MAADVEQPLDANEQALLAAIDARRQRKAFSESSTKLEALPDDSGSQS